MAKNKFRPKSDRLGLSLIDIKSIISPKAQRDSRGQNHRSVVCLYIPNFFLAAAGSSSFNFNPLWLDLKAAITSLDHNTRTAILQFHLQICCLHFGESYFTFLLHFLVPCYSALTLPRIYSILGFLRCVLYFYLFMNIHEL